LVLVQMPPVSSRRLSVSSSVTDNHSMTFHSKRNTTSSATYQRMFWKIHCDGGSRYDTMMVIASNAADSNASQSRTAQCRRSRMTRRSVSSRYSSGSRGASSMVALRPGSAVEHVADEGDQRLSGVLQHAQDVVHQVRRRAWLRDHEEQHQQ